MKLLRRTIAFLMILIIAVACRQQTLSAEDININISVTGSLVGETTLIVTVTDDEGNVIENPGVLSLRGDMEHAGMLPVIRDSSDSNNGVFSIPFEWTMGGAWTVEATLTLENGNVATESFDFEILTEADHDMDDMDMATEEADHDMDDMDMATEEADHDMDDMDMATEEADHDMDDMDMATEEADHDMGDMDMATEEADHDMGDMDMGGETSAVYMTITNNGDEPITIVGAESDVAKLAELHETVIENDIASMQPVDTLVIEAGETLDLSPGRIHIMLMELTQDIVADENVDISLILDSGDTVAVTAHVQDMLMDDLDDTIDVGDLVFSNVWARPASAGDMDMDHDMGDMEMATEEADSD